MAKYQKTVDIWAATITEREALQTGQWITAGPNGARGIWCGITKSGSCVAVWCGNMSRNKNPSKYIADLIAYSKG
jgi:hypothetical protein|tara:strand:+ start:86 stop:310 length:225 start_codon:yes stop_codon:yes gene_type:complete